MVTIDEWVEVNVKPNVIGVHKIDKLVSSGFVTQYDISVLVKTEEGTNIVTQPVNEYNGEFSFGNRIVKNFTEPLQLKNKELEIKKALTSIKLIDPDAKYIGMDTSSDLTVVKFLVGGVNRAFSLIDGELITLEVA